MFAVASASLRLNQESTTDIAHNLMPQILPGLPQGYRLTFFTSPKMSFRPSSISSVRECLQARLVRKHGLQFAPVFRNSHLTWYVLFCYALDIFLMHVVQAALWDRTFGGATLILHVEGATRPNAPRLPEYIKSDVYFPGYLIEADPRLSPIISELVQKFIVDIGMPVIGRWEQCARSIWPLTQGAGGRIPLPYPSQPIQPAAIPRGSCTFIYNGRLNSDQLRHVVVDDDEYEADQILQSTVDAINMMEQRDTYKAQLDAVQSMLSATEEALGESLAREEQLRFELSNARGILSTRIDGTDSNVNVSRRQLGSASRHSPHTPRITPHISRITSPMPASHHGNAFASSSRASPISRRLFGSPSPCSEGPSESDISPEIDALAAYYDFLTTHQLTRLRSTLDLIRRSIPISSWAEQLEKANVPSDLIDSVMVLMAATGMV